MERIKRVERSGASEFVESSGRVTGCFLVFGPLLSKLLSYLFMNRRRVDAPGREIYLAKDFRRGASLWKSITAVTSNFADFRAAEFHGNLNASPFIAG